MRAAVTMPTDVFFDTNVLVYMTDSDPARASRSRDLVRAGGVISVQVLNEFTDVARRKLKLTIPEIRLFLLSVRLTCLVVPVKTATHERGVVIAERYGYRTYDCMIIAAAQLAGCKTLYSEDLQHGQVVDGLRIVNPYV